MITNATSNVTLFVMFMRKLQPALAALRTRQASTGSVVSAKPTKLAQRMEAIQEAEDARQVFVLCSGMHTPYIKWIIKQICFCTWWVKAPGSCAEYVVPALTNGISQHWENVVAAQAEIAVYAALAMTLYMNLFLGGFAPANSTEEFDLWQNPRSRAALGYIVGVSLGLFNIVCGVAYRLMGAYLPRESDKLAVLWTYRWIPPLNVVLFTLGILAGLLYGLDAGYKAMYQGDVCMPDGSMTYLHWYLEWVRESYPTGKGLVHPLNEHILNPWAVAADAAGIERPDAKYEPSNRVGRPNHASFQAYEEFMASHLGLQGTGCYGGRESRPLILLGLILLLFPMLLSRNPLFYLLVLPVAN